MRRSIGWSFLAVTLTVVVIALVASQVPFPNRNQQQTSLAQTAETGQATSSSGQSGMTPTRAPSPTPSPASSPADGAKAALNRTPDASPASPPALRLFKESNGIRIGCEPGAIGQYLTCEAKEPGGFSMTFYLYLPRNDNPKTKYPLVLLLEGGGERADPTKTEQQNRDALLNDPYAQVWGPGFAGPYSENVQARWPSFVVIPQLTSTERFVDVPANVGSYTMAAQPNDSLRMTKEIVDTLQLVYKNIDANRLYLTGLSMGGYGAWEAAERWPHYFAAAAPIAGAGDPSHAARLVTLPIWAFQSADDPIVPISGSRDMIRAIRAAGGNPRYTEYTNQGHGSWLPPYTILGTPTPTPDFFSWLFAQHK